MMETTFTPISGLIGGVLIGLASAGLLLANGKIAGVSGILGRSFFSGSTDLGWRLAFLIGLPLGASFAGRVTGDAMGFWIEKGPIALVLSGLLVGVGTQLGNGCTSGHGVCGMSRGSMRSIVATIIFMTTAALTVYVARHVLGGAV
jgi:uncharacterized membrane protein YedE/YeeE